jgi:DNA-directed RNA polymerase specialized sigma24 family protein
MTTREDAPLEAGSTGSLPSTQLLLAGLLSMAIQDRLHEPDRGDMPRPEVTLADLGMTLSHIASLTDRNYESVKSTIRRGRAQQARAAVTPTRKE